jgi:hypothetical protein
MIPHFLHRFFWDHKPDQIDDNRYAFFIIERLLEVGNDEAIYWVFDRYPDNCIIEVVKSSRSLSRKTANFWTNHFRLDKGEVLCLQTSSQTTEPIYWPG